MQIPADPLDAAALAAALAPGKDRRFSHLLEVDWSRTGLFDHPLSDLSGVATSVQFTGEVDDSTAGAEVLPSGSVAAELTITLGGMITVAGQRTAVSELLAPYNATSSLYELRVPGIPVRWTIYTHTAGRGRIPTQQFVGTIDERGPRRAGNQVQLRCLDAAVQLAEPAWYPPYAVDGPSAARVAGSEPQRGLASAVVDHLCNAAGLRTRPRPPWESAAGVQALIWLPLTGSFAPSAGRMYSIAPWGSSFLFPELYPASPALDPGRKYWVPGPFGLARNADPTRYPGSLIYTPRDSLPVWSGRSTSISAWVWCGPTAPAYDPSPGSSLKPALAQVHFGWGITSNYYAYRLGLASDGTTLQIQVEIGTSTMYRASWAAPSDAWRHAHAQLDHSAGPVRAKLIVDGVTVVDFVPSGAPNSQAAPILNPLFFPAEGVRLQPGVRVCDVMAWQETGAPVIVPERTFTPGAIIDPSLNELTHLPAPAGSAWETIAAIAAAEYACVTVSGGVLRFRNRHSVRPAAPSFTITLGSAAEVATTDTAAGAANAVKVTAQAGQATWGRAYDLTDVDQIVGIPGLSTWVLPTEDTVLVPETGTVPRLCQSAESASVVPVWSDKVDSGFVFCYDQTETEELVNQSLLNTSDQTGLADAQLVRIVVNSTSSATGRFRLKRDQAAGTDPQPALRIAGLILALSEAQTSTSTFPAAIAAEGSRITLDLGTSPWHQHLPCVEATGRFALRRASQGIPTFAQITVPGDPRREVTDGCVLELGRSGQRVIAYLAGITRSLEISGSGTEFRLTDSLTVRATHAPGKWALGDPILGRLGTAKLG